MRRRVAVVLVAAAIAGLLVLTRAPLPERAAQAAARVARLRVVARDVEYRQAAGWAGRLDIYRPLGSGTAPVALLMHGGGWVTGSKNDTAYWAAPFLLTGYAVIAVGYRLADVALAPAAVEDVRCALRWIARHAQEYNVDPARIIAVGDSAGGHLALMAGLLRETDGFDATCSGPAAPPVRAVINFYGSTDVADLISGASGPAPAPADWPFALTWVGNTPDRDERARRVSPLSWVRQDAPPVFTAHGTDDALVPYQQATTLHAALDRAGVANELVTVEGRGHGDFSTGEWVDVVKKLRTFLARHLPAARE